MFFLLSSTIFSKTVSITQLGFIIKKSLPDIKIITVIYPLQYKDKVVKDAKMAYSILRKKIIIFDISRQFELSKKVDRILKYKKAAVIMITDNNMLTPKIVKFISRKLEKKAIPLITNRKNDTKYNAIISMFYNNAKKLELHINNKQLQKLNLKISDSMIEKFIVDVKKSRIKKYNSSRSL
jgi:hypothetical protein